MRLAGALGDAADGAVARLSRALSGGRWTRRSFLVRTSVVGSALAMDLRGFAFRPVHAYDSVCGTLTQCDDAFTAFCCTINNGANLCPDRTFVGGWWKADRSGFCRGSARYYVDCNGTADGHWRCHCSESRTCDQRKVACNIFRYGNCNLEIKTEGTAVVCRVITCTPPWEWDPGCTQTSFTDESTGSQSAPCLPRLWSSPIVIKWSDTGGAGGPLGPEKGQPRSLPDGDGTWGEFRDGAIYDVKWLGLFAVASPIWPVVKDRIGRQGIGYPANDVTALDEASGWSQAFVNRADGAQREDAEAVGTPTLGTYLLTGAVLSKWHQLGGAGSLLGVPTSDTLPTLDGTGLHASFAKQHHERIAYRGAIYSHPIVGAHAMRDTIYEKWRALGGEASQLGLPLSDEMGAGVAGAHLNDFAVVSGSGITSRGAIVLTSQFGAHGIWGLVHSRWVQLHAHAGSLGFPTSDVRTTPDSSGEYATFSPLSGPTPTTGGGIVSTKRWGAWALLGPFYTAWLADQHGARVLGVPSSHEVDQVVAAVALRSQAFSTGAVYDSAVGPSCVLYGGVLTEYLADGGPTGSLGLPTSSVVVLANGDQQATFQHGTLTYVPAADPVADADAT